MTPAGRIFPRKRRHSALFISIPAPVALEFINRKFTEHINEIGTEHSLENTCFIHKDKVISLLELVLTNYVFSFRGIFYQQLQGAAIGSLYLLLLPTFTWNTLKKYSLGLNSPWGNDVWMMLLP